ncbi:hypothetical protein P154DRAFT_518030 [Amniculicola lignicola CBS 123094]|uniref:RING-type domain-containing protein n=1 Tax=Amniculicola lignicola CBS 123094 TaxID=1392246 RepID=A0A6A5WXU2_9PLEO|nr:hypothetical protein P154DRAFT_518030 [Amniculicola lignicola CBS 123094]
MPSSASRRIAATQSRPILWDPETVLELLGDSCCVGYAPSKRRKCHMPISFGSQSEMDSLLNKMSKLQPGSSAVRNSLQTLATTGLCRRFHQYQADDVVNKWERKIRRAFPEPEEDTRSASEIRREDLEAVEQFVASFGGRDTAWHRLLISHIETRATPASNGDSSSTRTSTPSRTSAAIRGPARSETSTSSRTSPSTRTTTSLRILTSPEDSSPFRTPSIPPPSSPRSPATQSSSSSPLATVAESPRAAQTPPSPRIEAPPPCRRTHVARRSLAEECSICYDDENMSEEWLEDLVWCKSSCGNSVHKACFELWKRQCGELGRDVTCTICRARWDDACPCDHESPS